MLPGFVKELLSRTILHSQKLESMSLVVNLLRYFVRSSLTSKFAGRDTCQAFEDNMHVFGVLESTQDGDPFRRQIRGRQQLANTFDLHLPNLFLRCTAEVLSDVSFQGTARDVNVAGHFLDGDASAGVLPDKLNRLGDDGLKDGHHFRPAGTDRLRIGNDARQWRGAHLTKQIVVIHSNDRDLFRHRHTLLRTDIQQVLPPDVVAGHDPNRPRELPDPVGKASLLFVPRLHPRTIPRSIVHGTLPASPLHGIDEGTLSSERPRLSTEAKISTTLEATLQQVFCRESANRHIVGRHISQGGVVPPIGQFDE